MQKLAEKLCEELSAEENKKIRINHELWIDYRVLRSRWNLNKISSGGYAIVREMEE